MCEWSDRPLALLQPSSSGLELNETTARMLENINQPLVVISIAGKYRTGKSYILNLLSNLPRGSGFELGSTVQSKTKGIWAYALPHPSLANTTLLLLDTEGLGDVDKGDQHYDTTLLILTILLSSTFIYNVVGRLDDEVINQLGLVSTLSKSMISKERLEEKNGISCYIPRLFVLIRDFYLELCNKEREITADEYLNDVCLKIKNGDNVDSTSDPRHLIRKHFPKRHCTTLPPPVYSKELLRRLESVPDEQLDSEFLEESSEFVQTVLSVSEPKAFTENTPMNGSILLNLLRNYMQQITSGSVPSIESSLQSTANFENCKLLKTFTSNYDIQLRQRLVLPVSYAVLNDTHQNLFSTLVEDFRQKIIFDDNKSDMLEKFKVQTGESFKKISLENEEESRKKCLERLRKLSAWLNNELIMNRFHRRGGHSDYNNELQNIISMYNNVAEKEIKHDEVLSEFICKKENEGKRILAIEEQLVEAERKAEAARIEKEQAEERARLEQELAEKARRDAEEQRRIQEETQRRLQQELEERERQDAEFRRNHPIEHTIIHMQNNPECIIL